MIQLSDCKQFSLMEVFKLPMVGIDRHMQCVSPLPPPSPHMFPPLHFGAGLKRISVSRKQRQLVLTDQVNLIQVWDGDILWALLYRYG